MHNQFFYITGSSSGLGKAMAEKCIANGNTVVGISRNQTIKHALYRHISIDLSKQESLLNFEFPYIDEAKNASGIVLINNAATVQPVKHSGRAKNADIIRAYNLNIIAPAVLTNLFINNFADVASKKSIVNISSGAANSPVEGWSVYCSTKAALDMYSKVVAMEQEKEKFSCVIASIAPGIVDTPMQTAIRHADLEDFSRLNDFLEYKNKNMLTSPEVTAEKILNALEKLKTNNNVVFSVKN